MPEDVSDQAQPALPVTSGLDRRVLFLVFFFAAYFYLLYQLARILSPFVAPLLGAVMLALIFIPLHARIARLIRRPTLAAGLTTLAVLVTIVVPVIVLVWLMVKEAADVVPAVRDWVASQRRSLGEALVLPPPLDGAWTAVWPYLERWQGELRGVALDALREIGNRVTGFGAATVRGFFGVLLDLVVLVFALFFFLRDGPAIVRWIVDLVPMEDHSKRMLLERLDRTLSAMIRGTFITASAQGVLTGAGLAITGVPFPVLLGFAAALLSVVPFVGTGVVWLPAAIYLLVTDQIGAGLALILWGALVVGLVDNFLRPYVIGEQAELPVLLLLVGVLGGIQVYGLVGALVSPLVIASVLAFARIYREQYVTGRTGAA